MSIALPIELYPQIMVGMIGLEPMSTAPQAKHKIAASVFLAKHLMLRCSNQLSYIPIWLAVFV